MSLNHRGFTLLEMSIVLIIIAVILAGGAMTFAHSIKQKQLDETNAKIAAIQKALKEYRLTFDRLPCPSNIKDYNPGDSKFGMEAFSVGDIYCDSSPYVNFTYSMSYHKVMGGLVPVRTLQLPDDYAFDGWGRRFLYAVDTAATRDNAFTLTQSTTAGVMGDITADAASAVQRITVKNPDGYSATISGLYVILSYGANGHGAYPRYLNTVSGTYYSEAPSVEPSEETGTYQLAANIGNPSKWQAATDWKYRADAPPTYTLAGIGIVQPTSGSIGVGELDSGTTSGGSPPTPTRVQAGVTNAMELENCDCTAAGADGTFNNTFYQGPITEDPSNPANDFDDILVFATRGDLASAAE